MNKIIKFLEENKIEYTKSIPGKLITFHIGDHTLELVKEQKTLSIQKYKGWRECSPAIEGNSDKMIRVIKHELRVLEGKYSRI